jgi:hypothetical protein
MQKISEMLLSLVNFINDILVPVIFALAFIVFLWGVFWYLIAGAANETKRENGKKLVGYSLVGFAIMISVWGLVNLLVNAFGFQNSARPCLPTFGKGCAGETGTSGGSGGFVLPQDVYDQARQEASNTRPPADFVGPRD